MDGGGWKEREEEAGNWQEEVGVGSSSTDKEAPNGTDGPCQGGREAGGAACIDEPAQPRSGLSSQRSQRIRLLRHLSPSSSRVMPGSVFMGVYPGREQTQTRDLREGPACVAEPAVDPSTGRGPGVVVPGDGHIGHDSVPAAAAQESGEGDAFC